MNTVQPESFVAVPRVDQRNADPVIRTHATAVRDRDAVGHGIAGLVEIEMQRSRVGRSRHVVGLSQNGPRTIVNNDLVDILHTVIPQPTRDAGLRIDAGGRNVQCRLAIVYDVRAAVACQLC